MAFFNRDDGIENGYRRAEEGEDPDLTLNGIPQVRKNERDSDNGISSRILNRFTGGQDEKYGDRDKRVVGASNLRNGENSAASESKANAVGDGMDGARQSENNIASGTASDRFRNMVSGKDKQQGKGKFSFKNLMKKMMPALVAGGGVAGFGALSFLGQMAMPFSLISQFQVNFDSIGTSTSIRTRSFLKYQANPDSRTGLGSDVKDYVSKHSKVYQIFSGNSNDYFKLSKRQISKLNKAGIQVETDGLTGQQVMKYTDNNGITTTVVPDSSMANGSDRVFIDDFYENDVGFRNSYFAGAKTWRGAVGSWFDKAANKFLSYFGVKRGVWAAWKNRNDPNTNLDDFKTEIGKNADMDGVNGSAETTEVTQHTEEKQNSDGTTTTKTITETKTGSDSINVKKNANRAEVAAKASEFVNNKVTKLIGKAGSLANVVCLVSDVVGAINLVVMAYQTTQIIKVASAIFEGIQKGQVEDSKTTPLNEIATSLTRNTSYIIELADEENTAAGSADNPASEVATKTYTIDKSAMEANAVSALYGNKAVDNNDPSVQSFNITKSVSAIMRGFGSSIAMYKSCTFAKLGAALVSAGVELATTIAEVVGCAATLGIGCVFDAVIEIGKQAGKKAAEALVKNAIIGIIISAIVPFFANIIMRNIATDVAGEDLGNALVSGANIYMGQNHQYSGGSVASKESLTKFISAREEYYRDIARNERETRSPMDYTSQYTFIGTLINNFVIPINIQTGGVIGKLGSFSNIIGKSIASLTPGASAVSAAVTAEEAAKATATNCPDIDSIGGVADAFCNPYIITDIGTSDLDPAEVVYVVSKKDSRNFEGTPDDAEVPKINENSRLGHYIIYCGQRQSPFGIADQNIANSFKLSTGSTVGDSLIGAIPVAGSLYEAASDAKVVANYGYVSGESCVTGNAVEAGKANKDDEIETSDWSENKYYQRFIEDQRLAENMGLVEKSAVTAFLDDYYEKHPIDNSYEGVLARRSGLTKDQVVATLDIMDAIAFLENYDPNGYYPLNYSEPVEEKLSFEDTYTDNMNRGLAVADFKKQFLEERKIRNYAA